MQPADVNGRQTGLGQNGRDQRIEALTALAQMDLEAAAAYDAALDVVGSAEMRSALEGLRADHLRHIERLGRALEALGGIAVRPDPATVAESALTALVHAAGRFGAGAVLTSLASMERLTSTTYAGVQELPWADDVRVALREGAADEARHLRWLEEHRDQADVDELPASPS